MGGKQFQHFKIKICGEILETSIWAEVWARLISGGFVRLIPEKLVGDRSASSKQRVSKALYGNVFMGQSWIKVVGREIKFSRRGRSGPKLESLGVL